MDDISKQKLSHIVTAFGTYALGDIEKIQRNNMPIAAFILSVCFIDQVSGFIYDNRLKGQKTNTDRSKKFVSDYLNKVARKPYDKDAIIELLRNKLVHNYSLSDRKIPTHKKYMLEYEDPKLHLHQDGDKIFVNIVGFIDDLRKAFELYREQLLSDTGFQKIAIDHYDEYGILVHKELILNTQ